MFWTWGSYQSYPEKGGLENFPISGASFRNGGGGGGGPGGGIILGASSDPSLHYWIYPVGEFSWKTMRLRIKFVQYIPLRNKTFYKILKPFTSLKI